MNWLRGMGLGVVMLLQALGQTPPASSPLGIETESKEKLLKAKRVFVDSFGDDLFSKSANAIVMDAFNASKRFIVTESKEKADLILKGAALERSSQETHALQSSTAAGGIGGGAAIKDAQAATETVRTTSLTVRLTSQDGDVVWSTSQESAGSKYKGATTDAADKVIKQLVRDLDRPTRK